MISEFGLVVAELAIDKEVVVGKSKSGRFKIRLFVV